MNGVYQKMESNEIGFTKPSKVSTFIEKWILESKSSTTIKTLLLTTYTSMKAFEDYWSRKKAKQTNTHLRNFDVMFSMHMLPFFCRKEGQEFKLSDAIGTYYQLQKIDETAIIKTFRIPNVKTCGDEQKNFLVSQRKILLNSWNSLKKIMKPEEFHKKFDIDTKELDGFFKF